jgi:hypothetical protein
LVSLVAKKATGMVASQAAEDTFNFMKNHKSVKGKKKYRRVEKCMSTVLARSVLSKVHRFDDIQVDCAPETLSAKLSPTAFKPDFGTASLPFWKIVGSNSSPTWFSPAATNYSIANADLALVRLGKATGNFSCINTAWLGTVVRVKHHLLIRDTANGGAWCFAVHHWADSCVLLFPAKSGVFPGSEVQYWEPDLEKEFLVHPLCSFDGIEAITYTWKAPHWQRAAFPASCALPLALRAVSVAGRAPETLIQCAARQAFWSIEKTTLLKLGSFLGYVISHSASLFDIVFAMVHLSLPALSDELVLKITCSRVAAYARTGQWSEELMQVDEAVEVLDPSDEKVLRNQQKDAVSSMEECKTFKQDFKLKAKHVHEAAAKAVPKKKGKPKAVAAKYPARLPKFPEHSITVEMARSCVPEGGFLWADVQFGSWQGHFPPHPRKGRAWRKYGEKEALRLVLEDLWGHYLVQHGLDPCACPIKGIFPEGSGAASSSGG